MAGKPRAAEAASSLAYQDLQPDDIIGSVESLGLRSDGRLLALNSYENRVYRVGIEEGPAVVAKFYRPGRWSDAAILEEHAFTADLAAAEIPVVAPMRRNSATLHFHGAFRFAVYPCHGGRAPELDDLALLRQLGRLVARIHLIGAREPFRERMRLDLSTYGERSREFLLKAGFIPGELHEAYEGVCEHVFAGITNSFERAGPPRSLRLHGDFHPGNVLVLGEQLHIVDFDDTLSGPAVQDLWMFLSGDRAEQTPQLAELLGGYTEFRPFDAAELNVIEALRTLRIMNYAAWIARRWEDPAFQIAFPWFNTSRYWDEHVLSLREQAALMEEPPLDWRD
jgi:Ser/Thr protein kinase RdoA (MazF antagonist)